MKLIANANNLYTSGDFVDLVTKNSNIHGMCLQLLMAVDGTIIAYASAPNNAGSKDSLQESTFQQIQHFNVRSLESVLNYFEDYSKKIILNVLPLNQPLLSDETIAQINRKNWQYISQIYKIIAKYPKLDIYLYSSDVSLVQFMRQQIPMFKIGMLFLQPNSHQYMDVDFYVFSVELLDIEILNQQLKNGKEIMTDVEDSDDMNFLYQYVKGYSTKMDLNIIQELYFFFDHPEIFSKAFAGLL